MKKTNRKFKDINAIDFRKEWKDEAENEIDMLNESIDELDLPEDMVLAIEKKINEFKARLMDSISLFEITTEIAIDEDCLLENMLDEVYYGRAIANETEIERMIDLTSEKGVFIKINSLAERIKVEEFIEELTVNPYQLKLIA